MTEKNNRKFRFPFLDYIFLQLICDYIFNALKLFKVLCQFYFNTNENTLLKKFRTM